MSQMGVPSLADRVFEKLENDIIFGVYPRGEILTELKLVEQLGVSRTPIREALRRLEQERLISDTARGSVVLGITEDDLKDILMIRLKLEGVATYYATKNMTAEGIKELEDVLDLQEFYLSKGDTENIRRMDDAFHGLICKLSGHTVIADTLLPLRRKSQRYRKISIGDTNRTKEVIREHRRIFEAIRAGDAEAAEKLTAEHVENGREAILRSLRPRV